MKAVKKLASVLKGFFIIINVWLKVESMISILKLWKKTHPNKEPRSKMTDIYQHKHKTKENLSSTTSSDLRKVHGTQSI